MADGREYYYIHLVAITGFLDASCTARIYSDMCGKEWNIVDWAE